MSLDIQILPPANGSQRVVLAGRLDTHTYDDLDLVGATGRADG